MLCNSKIIDNLNLKFKMYTLSSVYVTNAISTKLNIFKITKNAIQSFVKLRFKIVIDQNNFLD